MGLQRSAGNRAVRAALVHVNSPKRAGSPGRLAQLASSRTHAELALAGTPRPAAAPDGRTFLYSKSVGVAGWTGVPNAAAYTNPDFQTDAQHERTDAGQVRHFAVVRPTASPDVTLESWFLGPGDHRWDDGKQELDGVLYQYFTHVSQAISDLVRDGEQEHVADVQRAYELGYGRITKEINALAGRRFGPASTPLQADQMALDALDANLPPALSTKQPAFRAAWVRTMDALLKQTTSRDSNGWHTMTESVGRREPKRRRYVLDLVPEKSTKINSVPSDQVVDFGASAAPAGPGGTPVSVESMDSPP
jgi:hypothetical protein